MSAPRTMLDAIGANADAMLDELETLPATAIGAGYLNGPESEWTPEQWQRLEASGHPHLTIVVSAVNAGDCLDIEKGDATIEQGPGWVTKRQAAGLVRPWCYIEASRFDELRAIMGGGTDVGYFVADWTGEPHEIEGADAVQWANPAAGSGGPWDKSTVYGTLPSESAPAPGPGPEPAPPAPQPTGDDDMQLYATNATGTAFIVAADLTSKRGIPDEPDGKALADTGIYKPVTLSDELLNAIPDAPNAGG